MSTSKQTDFRDIWNGQSSPTVGLLLARYRRLGLDRWSNTRIKGLMRVFKITLPEICAFAGEFHANRVARYWEYNRWPMSMTIHFAILESMWAEKRGLRQELIRDDVCMKALLQKLSTQPSNHNAKSENCSTDGID